MKIKKQKIIDGISLIVHLLAVLIIGLFAAGALRQNNLKMLKLREEVFTADKSGVGVEEALKNLRDHVSAHMNTKLPKLGSEKAIQLKYTFERRISEETTRFQEETAAVSSAAKYSCKSSRNELSKVECEQAYIKTHPVSPISEVYPEQYSIEFVSPLFSFDLAGWLIIATFIMGLVLVARIVALKLATNKIKNLYK